MVTNGMHYWEKFGFFGGHVFLDFLNTFDDLEKTRELDALPDWRTALKWSVHAGLITQSEHNDQGLLSTTNVHQQLKQLYNLRECGWRVLSKCATGNKPDAEDMNGLNHHIRFSFTHSSLEYRKQSFHWVTVDSEYPAFIRTKLGLSAAELLSTLAQRRLTECGGCTGLFINQGRGVGRRWCRMSTCGNRAKIRKFRSGKAG